MTPAERKPWSAIKRGTEAAFSLVLALLCFVAILAILGLSFPKGMGLRDVILPGDVATTGDGLAAREVDIGDAVLADVAVLSGKTRKVKNKAADAIAWGSREQKGQSRSGDSGGCAACGVSARWRAVCLRGQGGETLPCTGKFRIPPQGTLCPWRRT